VGSLPQLKLLRVGFPAFALNSCDHTITTTLFLLTLRIFTADHPAQAAKAAKAAKEAKAAKAAKAGNVGVSRKVHEMLKNRSLKARV
jgi:hypothetical protein